MGPSAPAAKQATVSSGRLSRAVAIHHGVFGGPPYAKVDATAVQFYKDQATLIGGGSYTSDTDFLTLEATLISFDDHSTYVTDRGGCIYIQTIVTGLQAGDVVRVDNNYLYDDGSGYASFWDQAAYWVLIGPYTHTIGDTINNWLIYVVPDGAGAYTLVIGSGEYNLALGHDDLTIVIGDQYRLTRSTTVYSGATLLSPLVSSRGYTYSTTGISGGTEVTDSELDAGGLVYVGATPVYVDDDWSGRSNGDVVSGYVFGQDAFESITRGINGVAAGATVNVAAGVFAENITIGKSLHLLGAGAGTIVHPSFSAPANGGGSFGGSQVIVVAAHDVEIANLVIDGDNPLLTSGVVRHGADVDARNGVIEADGPWNNTYVHHCTVRNIYLRGIYARSGGSGFHFADNVLDNIDGEEQSIAIMNWSGVGVIESNVVSRANDAICANWSRGTQFLNNTITQSGTGVHSDNNGGSGGVADLIQGNVVSDGVPGAYGVFIFFPYVNAVADDNSVSAVDVGLFAWGGAGGTATFTNNTVDCAGRVGSVGIYVTPGPDAWSSWQSAVSASFSANAVSNATYGFWVETDEDGSYGAQVASAGYVSTDNDFDVGTAGTGALTSTGLTGATVLVASPGRIAYGLDLAADDGLVLLDSGTFVEPAQVVFERDVTLQGSGAGTIITPGFNTSCSGHTPADAFLYVAPGATVTLQDFALNGSGRLVHHAIQSRGDVAVIDCDISNIGCGQYLGRGIALYTGTGYIEGCTLSNIQRIGIFVRGGVPGVTPAPVATIERCTYTGKGAGDWLDYGIEIGGGGVAAVTDCVISNNLGVATTDGSTSAGILATTYWGSGTAATLSGCNIRACTAAIAAGYDANDTTSLTAHGNYFGGNAYGITTTSTLVTVDATSNWWGSANGPLDEAGSHEVSPGDCADTVEDMLNVQPIGALGVPVDEWVDYCPWLESAARLELLPAGGRLCYEPGDELVVEVKLRDAMTELVGGQFYLQYTSELTFVSAAPGDAPFTEAYGFGHDGTARTIDYAVGVEGFPAGEGTAEDTVMARLRFTVGAQVCVASDLVTFRTPVPPRVTRLSESQLPGEPASPPIYPELVDLPTLSVDSTPPDISVAVADAVVDALCEATVTFSATVEDVCCLDAEDVGVAVALTTGNATLGTPVYTTLQTAANVVSINGSVTVSALSSCPATVAVTVSATDCCGNSAAPQADSGDVRDETAPVVSAADDLTVNADAGVCEAEVTWAAATALDNCDATLPITYEIDLDADGTLDETQSGASYTFPVGTHRVTASTVDACGNSGSDDFMVTVRGYSTAVVTIELEGTLAPESLTRCITLVFSDGTHTATYSQTVTFTKQLSGDGLAVVEIDSFDALVCGNAWSCVTAEDDLHTLTRCVPLLDSGTVYTAAFTGTEMLIQGDLIDRWDYPVDFVDIMDFGVYINQWGWAGSPGTTCDTLFPHADMSGDGAIEIGDFGFITTHFWAIGEELCCGSKARAANDEAGPLDSITLAELAELGLSELAVADLNSDGVVDLADVEAFMAGVTPKPKPPVPPVMSNKKLEPAPAETAPGLLELIPRAPRR